MAKLFVSYSRKDSATARKLIGAFSEMGHDVWVDWEDIPPASDWLEQIFRGIEQVDAFLFLVSPDSVKSEVCGVEIGRAALNNKRIIPVAIREISPKESNDTIRKLNWIFIRNDDEYETGLAKVKDAIELDFEWVEAHSRLQVRALEWHREKEPSLLLRGTDLRRARTALAASNGKEPEPTLLQETYVKHSVQGERRRRTLAGAAIVALAIMAVLTYAAIFQSRRASANADIASTQAALASEKAQAAVAARLEAEKQRSLAEENQRLAEKNQKFAEEQAKIAQAQRSAARAQIYQSQPDELYTSTLLAIASWQTSQTDEAAEILRKNISLLPIPVKQMQHSAGVNSLEFNPDGDLFVTGSADGTACVWKVSDGTNLFCATSPGSVNDAVFSPDGKLIAAGDDSGTVQIISVEDGSVQDMYEFETIVWDVDFRRDGKWLAVTRDDGRVTIIDIPARKRNFDLQAFGRLKIASFSPNGRYIAAGSNDGNVSLWNLSETGVVPSSRHRGEVLSLAFSPDSRYLVTGGADSVAVVARTSDGKEVVRLLQDDWVEDIAFSPDSSWFATVSDDRRIRLWNTTNGRELLRMSQDGFVREVKVSANGQWLATTGADRTVRVWNASTGTQMFQIPLKGEGTVLGFSKDGHYLVAGDSTGEVNIWDISVMPAPINYLQFDGFAGDVQFSPDGNRLAASDGNRVWLLRPGQLSTLKLRPDQDTNITLDGNVSEIVFSLDSRRVGISSELGNVVLYDFETNRLTTVKVEETGSEYALGFPPDGSRLITIGAAGIPETWDVSTGSKIGTLGNYDAEITSIATAPDVMTLGMLDKVVILNADNEQIAEIDSPGDHKLLAFNADGSLLASSNSAGNIEVWKNESGVFRLVDSIRKEAVYSLAFNPVEDQLAVGTINNVFLIDPSTVNETSRILHAGAVTGVSYSADGRTLGTSSLKAVQFWDLAQIQRIDSSNLVLAGCARLTANFTEAQWSNLFGGEQYRKLCSNLP